MGKKKGKKKGKKVTVDSIPVEERENIRFEPDEWYRAEFEEAEIREGDYGKYVLMKFSLLNGYKENSEQSAKGLRCTALMNGKITEGSDFWKFATVLAGREPKIGKSFKLSAYFGNKYKIFIEDVNIKKGKRKGETMQKVTKIRALKKKKK